MGAQRSSTTFLSQQQILTAEISSGLLKSPLPLVPSDHLALLRIKSRQVEISIPLGDPKSMESPRMSYVHYKISKMHQPTNMHILSFISTIPQPSHIQIPLIRATIHSSKECFLERIIQKAEIHITQKRPLLWVIPWEGWLGQISFPPWKTFLRLSVVKESFSTESIINWARCI